MFIEFNQQLINLDAIDFIKHYETVEGDIEYKVVMGMHSIVLEASQAKKLGQIIFNATEGKNILKYIALSNYLKNIGE